MKSTNTFVKLFGSVSTLAVVAGAMAFNSVALGQGGQVVAWGAGTTNTGTTDPANPEWGQSIVPTAALSGVTAIAGGDAHTIALKGGAVIAWGRGTTNTGNFPNFGQCTIPAEAQSGVTAIAGYYCQTIALKGGAVLAWGNNRYGQCTIPVEAQSGVTAIACGWAHTIALKGGAVLAWGGGTTNTGNEPDFGQCTIPAVAQIGVTAIAGGGFHTIAIKGGAVLAWGDSSRGQCTIPTAAQSGVTAVAGGLFHTIALKDGEVFAWGLNNYGQCSIPEAAKSGVTAIAGGYYQTIALKNGAVIAWERNNEGQCTIPADAQSGVTAIAGGYLHAIALKGSIATITGVLPISGSSSGGTNITITGTNFEAAATVTIGGAPATNVVVVSDTQITATTPAGFPGPAVVTVGLGSSTAFYYRPTCGSDLDNNNVVDSADLGIMLLDYGSCGDSAAAESQSQEPVLFQATEPTKPVKK